MVRTFVYVTTYTQDNNMIIKKLKKKALGENRIKECLKSDQGKIYCEVRNKDKDKDNS
jgi:hypothetical protein